MAASGKPKYQVKIAKKPEEKARLFAFRYRVYVENMGRDSSHADHDMKSLKDPLDRSAIQMYMTIDERIVACLRINLGGRGAFPREMPPSYGLAQFQADWQDKKMSMTDRLIIDDEYAEPNAAAILSAAAFKICRQYGVRFDFTRADPYLVQVYEMLGYRRYSDNFVDEDDGYQTPMVLLTEDLEHMQRVKSPLSRIAAFYKPNAETKSWFYRTFPDWAQKSVETGMSDERFWQMLTEKLHQTPIVGIPLLNGLSYTDAKRFLKAGTILTARTGDRIVRAGDTGNEMYVLLSGVVEIRSPKSHGDALIAKLERGAIFGEQGLMTEAPRSADVIAAEPCEIMVITQQFIFRAMEVLPQVSQRILFNMCGILIERLQNTSQALVSEKNKATPSNVGASFADHFDEDDDWGDEDYDEEWEEDDDEEVV